MAKIFIEESTLTAIGDAIRSKEGTSELVPVNDMASRISAISGGGGSGDIEPIVLSGVCTYACAGSIAGNYINMYGNTITTKDISFGDSMFYSNSTVTRIPFDLNFQTNSNSLARMFSQCDKLTYIPDFDVKHSSYVDMSSLFSNCKSLETAPHIYNAYPSSAKGMFDNCYNLRYIPDDYFSTWNNSRISSYTYSDNCQMFYSCYSLRKLPTSLFTFFNNWISNYSYTIYSNGFPNCFVLDEIVDIPVVANTYTSNCFNTTFHQGNRLKRVTFKTNEDGTPKTVSWKSQTIDLSQYIGTTKHNTTNNILGYNSGITEATRVKDDESYQALKNDPDWWTSNPDYSRYNHDSAVETINSLPDTSAYLATAGGTNTIKFSKANGLRTDGGAIQNLTEEEIAVATAKGWTVTLS